MVRPRYQRPRYGWRFAVALLLSIPVGAIWAIYEAGLTPRQVWERLAHTPEVPPSPTRGEPSLPGPPAPTPPAVAPTPPTPVAPPPADLAPRVAELFAEARFSAALELFAPYPPETLAADLRDLRDRADLFHALLDLMEPPVPRSPALSELTYGSAAEPELCEVLEEMVDAVRVRTLRGSTLEVSRAALAASPRPLLAEEARARIEGMLTQRAGRVGARFLRDGNRIQVENGTADGIVLFRLAEFAARWGAVGAVEPLLDAARRAEPALLGRAREVRAGELRNEFLAHVARRERDEARRTLETLIARFSETEAYRSLNESDVREAYFRLIGEAIPLPASDVPPVVRPPVVEGPRPEPPPEATLQDAARFEREGDGKVERAKERLRAGDYDEAKGLLTEAVDAYDIALTILEGAGRELPEDLLEKQREARSLLVLIRRRG